MNLVLKHRKENSMEITIEKILAAAFTCVGILWLIEKFKGKDDYID